MKTDTTTPDIVIIGGGHNGLVTAFYLAKAGFKPLVLERRPQVGGAGITDEFHPGFRCSTLSHSAGPIRPDIVRDMQLGKHGLRLITPETCRHSALAGWTRPFALPGRKQIRTGNRRLLAKGRNQVSRVREISRKDQRRDRRSAGYDAS